MSTFHCSVCGKSFVNNENFLLHISEHDGRKTFQECEKILPSNEDFLLLCNEEKPYVCTECGQLFEDNQSLVIHYGEQRGGKNCLLQCVKTLPAIENFEMHRTKVFNEEKPYICTECGKLFQDNENLLTHIKDHVAEKTSMDSENNSPRIATNLEIQTIKIFNEEKPYICTECGKLFQDNENLLTHIKDHVAEKTSMDSENNSPRIATNLEIQTIKIFNEEKPYICTECGKLFQDNENLLVHIKDHDAEKNSMDSESNCPSITTNLEIQTIKIFNEEKPYICTECGKLFQDNENLLVHIKDHDAEKNSMDSESNCPSIATNLEIQTIKIFNEEKPYICTECGKLFQDNENLLVHIKDHDAEKNSMDSENNSPSVATSLEIQTIKIVNEEKPYICTECGKLFQDNENLLVHIREHDATENCIDSEYISPGSENPQSLNKIHTGGKTYICTERRKSFTISKPLGEHHKLPTPKTPYKCTECGKSFQRSDHLKRHHAVHTAEKPFNCTECGKSFRSSKHLKRHHAVHTTEKRFNCTECGKSFRRSQHLKVHHAVHTTEKPFNCTECGKSFRRSEHLKRHQGVSTGEKSLFECTECGQSFTTNCSLRTHKKAHCSGQPWKCTQCEKSFLTRVDFWRHHAEHDGRTGYKCSECEKCFARPVLIKRHIKIHAGELHNCSECKKSFSTKRGLIKHMKIHTGEKPYMCPICKKSFVSSTQLKAHIGTHTGKGNFKCSECGKSYRDGYALKTHVIATHTQERPHKCSECGVSFKYAGILNNHVRIHTGEKPYKCTECEKCFRTFGHLQTHLRIHSGEKPYDCSECDKVFATAGQLRNHLMGHTGEKPFKCTECAKSFRYGSSLREHVIKFHAAE